MCLFRVPFTLPGDCFPGDCFPDDCFPEICFPEVRFPGGKGLGGRNGRGGTTGASLEVAVVSSGGPPLSCTLSFVSVGGWSIAVVRRCTCRKIWFHTTCTCATKRTYLSVDSMVESGQYVDPQLYSLNVASFVLCLADSCKLSTWQLLEVTWL